MSNARVILVTGTPCVGKTSVSRLLASRLDALYINLTDLAVQENLVIGEDHERGSLIVDEDRMRHRLVEIIGSSDRSEIIVDGHYAVHVVPRRFVRCVFVLRRDPVELREFMESCGFSYKKLLENLTSEILDVSLVDALNVYEDDKVCELNVTGKSVGKNVDELLGVLRSRSNCCVGIVDWLGKLEREGLLDQYLRL
jgi:adenylate kinase